VAEEAAEALDATDKDVGIGGAGLAAAAIALGLVDELRMFRNPTLSLAARRSFHRSPKMSRWI
jgi:dihydrofolate reductase